MTKKISHHQNKYKKPVEYDGSGMGFAEMVEFALDHPVLFEAYYHIISADKNDYLSRVGKIILWVIRKII